MAEINFISGNLGSCYFKNVRGAQLQENTHYHGGEDFSFWGKNIVDTS